MKYKGYFRQRKTDDLYTVIIQTKGSSTEKEILLGGTPFTTEMDDSDKIIYIPAKYQTATIEMVTKDYNFDIYSGEAQGTKIELYKGNQLEWTGYATPNTYDQGFDSSLETVEINAIDALSTLQYIKFLPPNKNIASFIDILNYLIGKCNAYKYIYVADNTTISTNPIMNDLYISKNNFFDQDEEKTDKENAWTCQDVLEEICQYLGLTAIADKDSVYLLDYDAIKHNNNYYYKYSVGSNVGTRVELSYSHTINADDFSKTGSTITLDNVYNTVKIKADTNTFDDLLPDPYKTAVNITSSTDSTLVDSADANNGAYGTLVQSQLGDAQKTNMWLFIDRINGDGESDKSDHQSVAVKYYNSPHYKLYKYSNDSNHTDITDNVTSLNYTDTKTMYGATVVKMMVMKSDTPYNTIFDSFIVQDGKIYTFNEWKNTNPGNDAIIDKWFDKNHISKVTLSNFIMLTNPKQYHISNNDITKYPFVETKLSNSNAFFGGKNAYLLISGSYFYHIWENHPIHATDTNLDLDEGRFAMDEKDTKLICKLQWGNLYWNGSDWVTTNSTFELPYMEESDKGKRRADSTMCKDMTFPNKVSWRIGTSEQGYSIKCPTEYLLTDIPTLTIYKPYDPNYHSTKSGDNKGQHYPHRVVFLKDLKMEAVIGDPTYSDTQNDDTIYQRVVDENYTKELSEIKFKINTWDNKKPNYSSVAYKDGDNFVYLDTTMNIALNNQEKGTERWDESKATDGKLRQEEHLIFRIVNQYSTPSIQLSLNLRNDIQIYGLYQSSLDTTKEFIVDKVDKDYQNNSTSVKLIEKK